MLKKSLKHIHDSLAQDSSLYIIGHFLAKSKLFPIKSNLHNLIFLNKYEFGKAYTVDEYFNWLKTTGFNDIKIEYEAFSDGTGIIHAVKGEL